jgi:hypothetical protein
LDTLELAALHIACSGARTTGKGSGSQTGEIIACMDGCNNPYQLEVLDATQLTTAL